MPLSSKHLSVMHILCRLWRMSLPKANRGDSGRSPSGQSQVDTTRNCHQWFGVALNIKNMFGAVPGAKYGCRKIFSTGRAFGRTSSISARLFRFTVGFRWETVTSDT